MDPVVQHSYSPYEGFNSNPILFKDPSGAFGLTGGWNIPITNSMMDEAKKKELTKISSSGSSGQSGGGSNDGMLAVNNGNGTTTYSNGGVSFTMKNSTVGGQNFSQGGLYNYSPNKNTFGFSSGTLGAFETASAYLGFSEAITYNSAKWLGKNGKFYPTTWGGNQFSGSRLGAINASKIYSFAGKATFWGSTTMSAYNFAVDPSFESGTSFTLNTSVSAYATWGGPIGWVAGILVGGAQVFYYFGGGKELGEKMSNKVRDAHRSGMPVHEMIKEFSCFVKGTKILMADYTSKNIEDILIGDSILSVNIENMMIEPDLVIDIPNTNKKYKIIEANFDNGVTNKFSPAHPYWIKGKGWSVFDIKEAKNELTFEVKKLTVGDVVLFYDGGKLKEAKILLLKDTGNYIEMYNIEFVKKNHTFFANKILVHNKRL